MPKRSTVVGAAKVKSTPTGRYWPCQSNHVPTVHPRFPVANAIKLGPGGGCFVHCGCGDHHFFTKRADPQALGYDEQAILDMGYVIAG